MNLKKSYKGKQHSSLWSWQIVNVNAVGCATKKKQTHSAVACIGLVRYDEDLPRCVFSATASFCYFHKMTDWPWKVESQENIMCESHNNTRHYNYSFSVERNAMSWVLREVFYCKEKLTDSKYFLFISCWTQE